MLAAIRRNVTVQKGGMIQIYSPELTEGEQAEALILLGTPGIDESDSWGEEDIREITLHSISRVSASLVEPSFPQSPSPALREKGLY